ncbi:UDP-glucuronic acid decarboxylase family protein [Coralloluteibacterium stylophorae]|uniref:UDP-glucuronate decarboxylase n=1 Tax=Coralloluteibacterium stylophorae TaxID=1776034 RepID=A0A8J7VT67_9GAMM|nr:UDP-glucuronic acid decarboxylase family protein [Coralloluteibacterium stylophorae]MBS7456274.1 SDR family oxidoreductase [Coralloluteibacterium stylophorae]
MVRTTNVLSLPAERPLSILVVGAAGFVGSHLVDRLLDDGHRVIAVDNLITGRRENIAHLQGHARFRFIEHDIIQPLALDEGLDWVMHLASPASPPKYQHWPIETLEVNSFGTHHLLDLAREKHAKFFLASTSEVYGDPLQHPQKEEHWGNCNPNGPRSMYDEGKRYAEAAAMAYHRHYGLPVRIIRIFNTYGPRMDPHDGRIVTNFIRQALAGEPLSVFGDGAQTRSLQYVSDLVEGIVRYMKVDHPGPVNLGNPVERTVKEIAEMILRLTGSASPLSFHPLPENDPKRRRPDISLAQELLDWTPTVSAEEGLARTIEAARHDQGLLQGARRSRRSAGGQSGAAAV